MKLDGKIALVIGGTGGIGSAICEALRERYYESYSMVLFVADVEVLRPGKF